MNVALLLVLALPENPPGALQQLESFGQVPACVAEATIVRTPRALPALEGKYAELLPFLEHSNRKVVLRAVSLICRTGAPEAAAQVQLLARRFPCEGELTRAAAAMTVTDTYEEVPCPKRPEPVWRASASLLAQWKLPAQAEVAKAISAGDATLLEATVWQLDALDPSRAQRALATLAQVDAVAAFLPTVRALSQLLGKDLAPQLEALQHGVLGAQLKVIAAKSGTSRAALFCAVIATGSLEDFELLRALQYRQEPQAELSKAAERARRGKDLSAFAREYLEELATPEHDWAASNRLVSKMVDHRDRPSLRAYVKDAANGLRDRLRAARALALLGDATGLMLFQSTAGLWPELYKSRRQELVELQSEAPTPVREQAQALLAKSWTRQSAMLPF